MHTQKAELLLDRPPARGERAGRVAFEPEPQHTLLWWKRNIYLGIAIHCALNLVGNSLLFAAALDRVRG